MSQLGKRYQCPACKTQVLCTKASKSNPECCGKEMTLQKPKKSPSSD